MKTEFARRFFRLAYGFTFYLLFAQMLLITLKCPEASLTFMLVELGLFVSSYFLREHIRRIWPLFLLALVEWVGIWFLPAIMLEKLLLWMLASGLFFFGSRYVASGGRLSEPLDIPWPVILIGIFATASGLYYEQQLLVTYAVLLSVVSLIFFLLILYTDGVRKYMDSTREVTGFPLGRMIRMNTWIVVVIFAVMLIAIVSGEALGLPDAVQEMIRVVKELLKTLFYGAVLLFKWIGNLFNGGKSGYQVDEAALILRSQAEKMGTFGQILMTILRFLGYILLVYILVRIMMYFIVLLMRRFQKGGTEVIIETTKPDIKERLKDRGLGARFRKYVSMEERARRIYRKRILDAAGDSILSEYETTGDILYRLQEERGVNLPELTALYEAVRYGGVTVDRAYLARMKKADRD